MFVFVGEWIWQVSLRGSIVARIPDTSACPSEITQQKRKLRIYISNTYTPSKPEGEEAEKVSSWELRVEGKLLEEVSLKKKNTFECSRYCPGVVWLQVFQSLSLCFFKLELASVLGSDYAARCVFTAFLIPPHNCWHTHTLRISFEIRNWNHWPLHTMSWLASFPDINSSSTHCVIWGHMKEKEVFFSFFFVC